MGRYEAWWDDAGGSGSLDRLIGAVAIIALVVGVYRGLRAIKRDFGALGLLGCFLGLGSQAFAFHLLYSGERWLAFGAVAAGFLLFGALFTKGAKPPPRSTH